MDETPGMPPQQPTAPSEPPSAAVVGERPGPVNDTSKILAALGYLIVVVAIVAMLIEPYKNEKFVKFHAVQGIALWVVGLVVNIVPVVGQIVSVAIFVVMIIGLIKAFQGQYWEIPVLYGIVKGFIGEE